ncbi:hypothetical protein IMG5_172250 [Ichthyophthirius multifiliis]|uniref:Steroid 5-alpha reductase C-terminal domain-containing protein n=1 Tax=Ichthyophthirius multifiliis TaxID=5932 RepID=G0R1R0_ICHMU|nr:hypothetical protein IMG5_172250 [Ichthyophthirius multifiliis]EGR28595.1 hypothetical protein IMG5_172250 [Ichthyophthirius multifiliis]|eukprot:XP_004029831.1 hypothetical protein IMG5_172250 [Ichthyophthirius multifiliis]
MFQSFFEAQQGKVNLLFCNIAFDITFVYVLAIFNFFWNNIQIYDAYYSLGPLSKFLLIQHFSGYGIKEFNGKNFILTILMYVWSVRLFTHIFGKWEGFPDQDKRITTIEFKGYGGKKRFFFWLWFSPFIAFMNALLISFLTLPVTLFQFRNPNLYDNLVGENLTLSDFVGFLVAFFGLAVQTIADQESVWWRTYGKTNKVADYGTRRYVRYPQYFGEIIFWAGVYIFTISSFPSNIFQDYSQWIYWPIGNILETLWLCHMSDIMDNQVLKRKDNWKEYKQKVKFALIPFFRF